MAIKKENFRGHLRHYMALGMSPREAYQRILKEGLDESIVNIPNQINSLVNSGVPFDDALWIIQAATIDGNFDPYRAALQEYKNKGRVYRSSEPNGKDRIDVDKIVRDTLSNKPELGNGYYPPMGMSTFPNSRHSLYSVIPKHYTSIPSQYPYELDSEANQNLAPEGKLGLPITGMYDESAINTDMDEPSGKVVVGPDTEVNSNTPVPAAEGNTMKVYDTKTGTTNTYDSSTGELVSTSNIKQVPSVNSAVERANTPRTQQRRTTVTPPPAAVTPSAPIVNAPVTRPVMPAPNKTSLASAYKRDLWNLINNKGISSPAEAVQRGIIPAEYLNLF